MDKLLEDTFERLRNPETSTVNVKELKAYLYYANGHSFNSTAYKIVSDLEQENITSLTAEEYKNLFWAAALDMKSEPTIEFVCLLFEMLDVDKSGDISFDDVCKFLILCKQDKARLLGKKVEPRTVSDGLLKQLVADFDYQSHKAITPEQFYNIIMAAYEEQSQS